MLVLILIICLCLARGDAHGVLTDPRQRGALNIQNHITQPIDENAPIDYECHFPAGDKSTVPGSGLQSVKNAAGNNWIPYEPLNPFFKWRSGVCGDHLYGPQDHLRGGKYYWDAKRVRTYEQGSVVFFESEIITHHNGYYEFYICDIDRCGDDISPRCFAERHCTKMVRARGPCDSGDHPECGPIDRNNPSRWYLPCIPREPAIVGGKSRSMAYVLPPWLVCDHCVIQWYWTAANTCNPPGVAEYFTGPDAPRWRPCSGQGGAIGGWTSSKGTCGGAEFPEEYWQCSDVRIVPRGAPHDGHHGGGAPHAPQPQPHDGHHGSHSQVGAPPHHADPAPAPAPAPAPVAAPLHSTTTSATTSSGVFIGARSKDTNDRREQESSDGASADDSGEDSDGNDHDDSNGDDNGDGGGVEQMGNDHDSGGVATEGNDVDTAAALGF